jgi:uncharacterized protein YeaO (DUF488 family)
MVYIKVKRVYEESEQTDGLRVFVDRLWPRGMRKEAFRYDIWAKEITPSSQLRSWFHEDPEERWGEFASLYKKELSGSDEVKTFVDSIRMYPNVTLLYASKNTEHNHAIILKSFLDEALKK